MLLLVSLLAPISDPEALRVEGRIEYAGSRTGPVILGFWTGEPAGEFAQRVPLPGPGPFSASVPRPELEGPVSLGAFLDANGDGRWDLDEPFGTWPGTLEGRGGSAPEVSIALLDPPVSPPTGGASPPGLIEIELRTSKAATLRIDGTEVGRGIPVAWAEGRRARAAAVADLLPMSAGPSQPLRVRLEGKPILLGPAVDESGAVVFDGLEGARMAALLDGEFRVERRIVRGTPLGIAIERGAGLPEEEIVRAGESAAEFLAQAFGAPLPFLPLVVLGGPGTAPFSHGAPIAWIESSDAATVSRAVGRALAEAWVRAFVPDAANEPRLTAATGYLGGLAARAGGTLTPEAFLAAFEPGGETTLALLLDATIRDALDGTGALPAFLAALAPTARRGGGSLAPADWDRTLDALAGFDLSSLWRRVLEKPRGPFTDFLLARAGLRFALGPQGRPTLVPIATASGRASALRSAILRDGRAAFPPRDASTWIGDYAGSFEGIVRTRAADGMILRMATLRLDLRPGENGGLAGYVVEVGADGRPVPGTLAGLRLETGGEEVLLRESLPSNVVRSASGARKGGLLCLVERGADGSASRWERWRALADEVRFERWSRVGGEPAVEEGRLRRR